MLQMVRNKKHFYLRDRDIEQLRKASEKKKQFVSSSFELQER